MKPEPAAPADVSRRAVMTATAAGLSLLVLDLDARAQEKTDPEQPDAEPPAVVDLGPLGEFPEGVDDRRAKSDKLLVLRQGDRLAAASAICTHKRCTLKVRKGTLHCNCHGSEFDNDGIPYSGPAKRPLTRYAVSIIDGKLFADRSRQFEEKDWEAEGAFVRIPA